MENIGQPPAEGAPAQNDQQQGDQIVEVINPAHRDPTHIDQATNTDFVAQTRGDQATNTSGTIPVPINQIQFCNQIGIKLVEDRSQGKLLESIKGGEYDRILKKYHQHTAQYWLVASIINTLYLVQIIIGATATAISAGGAAKRSVTVLTAIGTVVAGVLAFFKSRGQPNRVRQLRNDLRTVCDHIRFTEVEFSNPACTVSVAAEVNEVRRLYDAAMKNAETNYPDTWSLAPIRPKENGGSPPNSEPTAGNVH